MNDFDRKENSLFEFFLNEYNYPFSGWDFSHINHRMVESPLPWSYVTEVLKEIHKVDSILDMGTGGGEFLLNNFQPFPKHTCATESYVPNIPIARKNLEPLGVKVYPFKKDSSLPFENEEFELVINRHESYDPKEVYRITEQDGCFITQQVDGTNDLDLIKLLDIQEYNLFEWNVNVAVEGLEKAGFTIVKKEEYAMKTRIFDVGAIIYYLKIVPWSIPKFEVEQYREKLYELHKQILDKGYIDITTPRFLIKARKF